MPPSYIVPEKSQSDNREYRIFTLDNQLQVLLISDETTEKAAAAIGVGVGYHSDPEDAPGLAHLLEHMLFQGTEKYPASDAFSSFLAEHGGKSNAHTSGDETVYYFDVLHEHLRGALEIWSQFFITPLMNQEKTELELQAVDSENGKNLQSDPWRFNQLLRSRAKPGHPYTHFGTGNYKTLSSAPNLRERLLQFHDKYYSSNIMQLAILGQENLDVMEKWAHEFFNQLKTTNVQRPSIPPDAFGPEQLQKILYTVPVKETSQITFTWPIPPQKNFYEKKPASYLSHLVGHEAAGSILSILKKKGWANELMAGPYQTADTFSLFKVDIELTNEGLEHVTEIAVIVYQYLKLILEEGIKEWIYEENKFISEMRFRFKNKSEPFDYVQHLVDSMFNYPPQHVLTGVHLTTCFDRDLIKDLLVQNFPPSNLRIHVSSKKFAGITDQVESWYGTPFKEDPFSQEFVEKLQSPPPASESGLYLPGVNALIPRDFELKPITVEGDTDLHILHENDLFHIYHKQDRTFLRPKANVYFSFTAPICYQSPRNAVLTRLWTNILEDSLNEFSYDAHLAGLEYSLSNTMAGCQLILKGFNDKIEVLAGKVLARMAQLTIDEQRFDILREKLSREFKNVNKEDQFKRALYNGNLILDHIRWHNDSYIKAVDEITINELRSFTSGMLGNLFIEGILHGNITSEEAKKFARDIEEILKPKALLKVQIPEHRIVKIPKGNHIFREPGPNPENINQAVHNIYQIGMENAKHSALLDLISHILADPAYQQLRNVEQLGYIVWSFSSRSNGVQSYRVLIQSKTFTPDFLDDRIEQFLVDAKELLAGLTETEFRNYTASLAAEKLEKDKTLGQETNRYWREICNECYVFDRAQREVQAIEALTHEDLNAFFSKYIHPESQHRRKLSIQIWTRDSLHEHENPKPANNENGKETPTPTADESATSRAETANGATPAGEAPNQEDSKDAQEKRVFQSTPVVIRDYVEWKRRQGVYPLPTPGVF